jgi:spore germination protein KC
MYRLVASLLLLLLTAGCTRGLELSERAFVLGVAVDLTANQQILMTTQIYNPSQGKSDIPAKGATLNIITEGPSLFEAVRNITLQLGRKGQWSHIQMILIGEEVARSPKFREILDFFYRDDEPRLMNHISITNGKAGPYLNGKTLIENSNGRTLVDIQRIATRFTAKIPEMTLRELILKVQSEVSTALIPYVERGKKDDKSSEYTGGAVVLNKKMVGFLPSEEVQYYMLAVNKVRNAVISIPTDSKSTAEAFEIIQSSAKISTRLEDDTVKVKLSLAVSGTVREITHSRMDTTEETKQYELHIADTIRSRTEKMLLSLKEMKADAIGIGNRISKLHPRVWKEMKPEWQEQFEKVEYEIDVKVTIINTGLDTGHTIFSK